MDAAGALTAVNAWGTQGLLSRRSGGSSVFYSFDPQGSVAQRLDAGANVLTSHMFDAHGVGLSTAPTSDPYGYKAQWGYYRDTETGLLLLTHRYLDVGAGRFLNRDPIGYAGGVNLYSYVTNDPVGNSDPSGLLAEWIESPARGWLPLLPPGRWYRHAWIRFGNNRTPCSGKSYGFWRRFGNQMKNKVRSPDPDEADGGPSSPRRGRNDPDFERHLCDCVRESVTEINVRRNYPPPPYSCGSWARDMWNCAEFRMGEWYPSGYYPSGPW
jgi:RHS repeat-associated protein